LGNSSSLFKTEKDKSSTPLNCLLTHQSQPQCLAATWRKERLSVLAASESQKLLPLELLMVFTGEMGAKSLLLGKSWLEKVNHFPGQK